MLLDEIWLHIFQFFDFETVQRTLTLVCKKWFNLIRNDIKLSGSLRICWRIEDSSENHHYFLHFGSINTRLKNWPKLQNLQLSIDTYLIDSSPSELIDGIDFEICPLLNDIQLITGKPKSYCLKITMTYSEFIIFQMGNTMSKNLISTCQNQLTFFQLQVQKITSKPMMELKS